MPVFLCCCKFLLKWREKVVAVYFGVIVHSCEMKGKDLRSISVWLDTAL